MKRIIFILINLLFISQTNFAQDSYKSAAITGTTTNKGTEIPYVSIVLKGTTIGTSTNENGKFNLTNLKPGFYTIQIQSIGYKPFEQTIRA